YFTLSREAAIDCSPQRKLWVDGFRHNARAQRAQLTAMFLGGKSDSKRYEWRRRSKQPRLKEGRQLNTNKADWFGNQRRALRGVLDSYRTLYQCTLMSCATAACADRSRLGMFMTATV